MDEFEDQPIQVNIMVKFITNTELQCSGHILNDMTHDEIKRFSLKAAEHTNYASLHIASLSISKHLQTSIKFAFIKIASATRIHLWSKQQKLGR